MADQNRKPSPMLVLAADTLAARARTLLARTREGDNKAVTDLRQALDTYSEVRATQTINEAQAAQDEPCPKTERAT